MNEIGRNKTIRWKDKSTGEVKERLKPEVLRRVTRHAYGHTGRKRKMVVMLEAVDVITIKPLGTRKGQTFSGTVWDIYYMLVRGNVAKRQLEKAREKKEKLKLSRQRRQIADADRRLRIQARAERMTNA